MRGELSSITKLLLFSSGATYELILKCPRFEVNKYASIGLTVLFTAFLSVLSSFFAFNLIFHSNYISIPLAILWGGIIFNLDRYIVSSMRMNDSKWNEFLKSIPRLLIAILIAMIISKPLEIKLFSTEIENHLEKEKIKLAYEVSTKYDENLMHIDSKKEALESGFQKTLELRDVYYEAYKCECTGTCGTNVRGYGKECQSRKERYELFLVELEDKQIRRDSIMRVYSAEETKIKDLIDQETTLISENDFGLFDQIRALNQIDEVASFFIFMIFIMIETAPLLTKLLSTKGPYDNLVLEHEMKFETDYLKQVDNLDHERLKNKKLKEMSSNLELKSKENEIKKILNQDAFERYDKMRKDIDNKNINT